jgi:hypothetical protein
MGRERLPIKYNTPGRLTGRIKDSNVSVSHDGYRHFTARIDGEFYSWLSQGLVEEVFEIPVQKKRSGNQTGYPSESVIRALWRYFVDQYNAGGDVRYSGN